MLSSNEYPERRVWFGCLASYNAGRLHGQWFDLDDYSDADDLTDAIGAMLKASPAPGAEEFHICDHEGFCGLTIDRYESPETVWQYHETLEQAEESGVPPVVAAHVLREYPGKDPAELYCGTYESRKDYAEQWADDTGEIPEHVAAYINWQAYGRDLLMNMDEIRDGCELHIVDPNG